MKLQNGSAFASVNAFSHKKAGKAKGPPRTLVHSPCLTSREGYYPSSHYVGFSNRLTSTLVPGKLPTKEEEVVVTWYVWSQRMLTAVVMEKQRSFHKMGIDMSAAFDTIQRSTILDLLQDAGCSEDDIRLVRFLLSNTRVRVRIDKSFSIVFETTLSSFQRWGDTRNPAPLFGRISCRIFCGRI